MTANQSGSVPLSIAADHPAFAGHFPGAPLVPGVVLLDEALHAMGQAIGRDLSRCQISSIKFLSPVLPGEQVAAAYEISSTQSLRFDLVSGERKVATGAIRLPDAG